MSWSIDFYSEGVRLAIAALPVGIRASYARLSGLLMEFGLDLRMPHARAMGEEQTMGSSLEISESPLTSESHRREPRGDTVPTFGRCFRLLITGFPDHCPFC